MNKRIKKKKLYRDALVPLILNVNQRRCEFYGKTDKLHDINFRCAFKSSRYIETIADKLRKQGFKNVFSEENGKRRVYYLNFTVQGIPQLEFINKASLQILWLIHNTDRFNLRWDARIIYKDEAEYEEMLAAYEEAKCTY